MEPLYSLEPTTWSRNFDDDEVEEIEFQEPEPVRLVVRHIVRHCPFVFLFLMHFLVVFYCDSIPSRPVARWRQTGVMLPASRPIPAKDENRLNHTSRNRKATSKRVFFILLAWILIF